MIILQTGVPGAGKTSSVVAMLMTDESYTHFKDKDGVKKKRPLFVNGIPEFKLEHQELTDEQIQEKPFQDFLPYGSLVVIDEAQRLMGTRSPAKAVPEFIEALATHRHHGLDIILITQHPSFLDSFVRRLVQRHIHISIKSMGRKTYEWNECCDQPDSAANIARAVERNFTLPKKAFDQYKSAEVHTKPKRKIPRAAIFLALFVPALIWFMASTGLRMKDRFNNGEQQTTVEQQAQEAQLQSAPNPQNQESIQPINQNLTANDFVPTLAEKPESKPLYNGVRQVKTFERIAACVDGGKTGCTCYSDQATPLKEVTKTMCKEYARNGLPFNPYKEPDSGQSQAQTAPVAPDIGTGGQVALLGGQSPQNLMYDGYNEKRMNLQNGAVVDAGS